jgi:hypothetical protein
MSNLSTALQIFQDEVYSSTTELVANQVDLFNAATNGAIVLESGANQGDFTKEAMWKKISGLVRKRDTRDRASTVSAVDISHLLNVSVKVAAGTPPVNIDPDTLQWIQRSPDEYAQVISDQLAGDMLEDMLGSALDATVACFNIADAAGWGLVGGSTDTPIYTAANAGDTGSLTLNALNQTAKLFGDRSSALRVWVMHSTPWHDLVDTALTNPNRLFTYGTVNVLEDGLGRRFVVTDDDALVASGSPEGYNTLGLVEGAVVVQQNNDFMQNIDTDNGYENIKRTWQAQWSYNTGVKGYKWGVATTDPTDAEIQTPTNWATVATDMKDSAGVMCVSD